MMGNGQKEGTNTTKKAHFLSSKDLKLLPILREANDCGRMEEE